MPSVLDALPVKKLWGIGSHTEEKLRAMGITTCGELGRAPLSLLTKKFGIILHGIHLRKSVRLFGITLSALGKDDDQMGLFRDADREKRAATAKAMDAVNDKFDERSITFASTIREEKDHKVISPAWCPSGVGKSAVQQRKGGLFAISVTWRRLFLNFTAFGAPFWAMTSIGSGS